MGDQNIQTNQSADSKRRFTRAVLDDLAALSDMLDTDLIESGTRRIGAEQEMFLIDKSLSPAPVATQVLEALDDKRFTTELARFNLEANCDPRDFGHTCLSDLEKELNLLVSKARAAANTCGADVLLVGILPTLSQSDLSLENMTPLPRYAELNRAMCAMRGNAFRVHMKGLDELEITHDNVMLEACNTSFQLHFQVGAKEFASLYNLAQAVTAPVLAAAVNSPLLLGQRLWHETRVGLFQQSVDARSPVHQSRGHPSRVSFGDGWVKDSVIEIFQEDIARFRSILDKELDEDPRALMAKGIAPELNALRLHNGTIYRWNRACYGVASGVAHLRVENRVLPSGPTVLDEVANAAFFFGLMTEVPFAYGKIDEHLKFDHVKDNFFSAARYGLNAQFRWTSGRPRPAADLILHELLPLARKGLERQKIEADDIERYLGVLEARVASAQTGAMWAIDSLAQMDPKRTRASRLRGLTRSIRDLQADETPVHRWPLAQLREDKGALLASYQSVEQFMTTEVLTLREDDLVDLAASMMEWEQVRHLPVEDDEGRLIGMVSHRDLLRLVARGVKPNGSFGGESLSVGEIMEVKLTTVAPCTHTTQAIRLMREHRVAALPVVDGDRLVGIVTERDILTVAAELLERELKV